MEPSPTGSTMPRVVISGLSGGAGKTMVSLGLARAFARKGIRIRTFKKGPDFIDACWLSRASRSPQANLDPYFCPPALLHSIFTTESAGYELSLIEGNRGLFDGLDISGSCSTAEVARILGAPVILVLDCTKMTRTAAALVKGCLSFEKDVRIGGVILNRTGNDRHRALVRRAVEELTGVPVLGVLPRLEADVIHERHMGLSGLDEHSEADELLDKLADFVSEHADLDSILDLGKSAPPLAVDSEPETDGRPPSSPSVNTADNPERSRIGYVRDRAFWFYYRENLAALEKAGAELVPVSLLAGAPWPELDGLYIGGGLPELHLSALSSNIEARRHVADLANRGLPIYAECGGFMYLCRSIRKDGTSYPMSGVFPVSVCFHSRPQGLGYVEVECIGSNRFHPPGVRLRGHEFHFSAIEETGEPENAEETFAFRLSKGKGMLPLRPGLSYDGLIHQNTFASYTHLYAPSCPHWAPAFVELCRESRRSRTE